MLRFLLLACFATFLRVCSGQSSSGNNSFINPPPDGSDGQTPIYHIGDTITARWSSNFSTINLVLWSGFHMADGNQNIIRLMSNEPNEGSREFIFGTNIDLSQGSDFFLEVHETDASNDGKETGRNFRTKDFNVVQSDSTSSAAPSTITQTLGGTTVVLSPSSTPVTTGSNTASASSTATTSGAPSPAPDNGGGGLSDSGKVGVGVGVGVGIPLVAVAAAALLFLLRRRGRKNVGDGVGIAHGSETPAGVEKPADTASSARYS